MAPVRKTKRASGANATAELKVPVPTSSPSTPQRSPIRRRRGAISLQQKQALIDNLQLELTERARRLRAQYNLQAQGLRSRIEIRINRIPMALRKLKMGDLLLKFQEQEEKRAARPALPAKDHTTRVRPTTAGHNAKPNGRGQKRMSDAFMGDKENEFEHAENAKKRIRAAPTTEARAAAILSPTSSNSRLTAARSRPASPVKSSGIARPASPLKSSTRSAPGGTTTSSALSNMGEKAKTTRTGNTTRKTTATSNTSSSSTSTTAATRRRAATTSRVPATRPATRNARSRVSNHSESSEASTGTVVKRGAAAKAAPARKGVMDTIRKGVAGGTKKKTTKPAAGAAAPASTAGTGRVLRKRN